MSYDAVLFKVGVQTLKTSNVPPTDQEASIHLFGCGTAVSAGGGGGTTVLLSRSLNAIKDGVNPDTVADISDHH